MSKSISVVAVFVPPIAVAILSKDFKEVAIVIGALWAAGMMYLAWNSSTEAPDRGPSDVSS